MLKSVLMTLIAELCRRLVGGDLFAHVEELVALVMPQDIPGTEKKERVLSALRAIRGDLAAAVAATATYYLSMAVDVAAARQKAAAERG